MFPLFPDKLNRPSITQPRSHLDLLYKKNPPPWVGTETAVISLSPLATMKCLQGVAKAPEQQAFFGSDLFWFSERKVLLLSSVGIGAPALTFYLEHLVALGVKQIFTLGLCGSFSSKLNLGDVVLCSKAFRDEGCSYHYLPASETPEASSALLQKFKPALQVRSVVSWTTDAPFRETREEILYFAKLGAQVVDMEASAALSLAQYHKVDLLPIFLVSDFIDPDKGWSPGFSGQNLAKAMAGILTKCIYSLA
jgi:purine-nucleoside phosphorylase